MIFDFTRPIDAPKARTRLEYLIARQRKVELTEKKDKPRTLPQNNLFHLWVSVVADELGYTDKEACKRDIKRTILGMKDDVNRITDEIIQVDYKTSEMSEKDLSSFMDKMKTWAATDLGIYLPYVGDPGYEEMYNEYKNR